MANEVVKNIIDNSKTQAIAVLPSTYKELRYIHSVENNDIRNATNGFAVRPLGASTAESVLKTYTLDHEFELILTNTDPRRLNDSQIEDALDDMYDQADDVFVKFVNSNLALPGIVLRVSDPTISEPELLNEEKLIVLRMQYTVKYRSPTN